MVAAPITSVAGVLSTVFVPFASRRKKGFNINLSPLTSDDDLDKEDYESEGVEDDELSLSVNVLSRPDIVVHARVFLDMAAHTKYTSGGAVPTDQNHI
jgi:hypothetical protein